MKGSVAEVILTDEGLVMLHGVQKYCSSLRSKSEMQGIKLTQVIYSANYRNPAGILAWPMPYLQISEFALNAIAKCNRKLPST